MTIRRAWTVGFGLIAVAILALTVSAVAEPVAPPNAKDLEHATETIRTIYADKAAKAKLPADRAALAREVFDTRAAVPAQTERYAVLMTALNLAAKGDDPLLVLAICDDLSASFTVDKIRLFIDRVSETTGPVPPATWPHLKEKLDKMASECLVANRFDDAVQLATAISSIAKRARDPKAATTALAMRKTIAERRKARERHDELAQAAKELDADQKVLLEFGRLLCFVEGDWAEGVRYLARCDDPALAAAAAAESKATTPEARLAVADAWAKHAEKANAADREPIREHAAAIYAELIPGLTGLVKVRAEKALDQVLSASQSTKDGAAWMVIFRSDNPKLWNTNSQDDQRNFAVPLDGLPSTIRFLRIRRGNGEAVIIPISRQSIGVTTRGRRYGWEGSKPERFGAILLGIIDNEANVYQKTGEVGLVDSGRDCCSGWGFGTRINHGHGTQAVCWAGKWISTEPLEIAVAKRGLTSDEQKSLLE